MCLNRGFGRFQLNPDEKYQYHDVVQKPIAPAYKEILEKSKSVSLRHQALVIDEANTAASPALEQ